MKLFIKPISIWIVWITCVGCHRDAQPARQIEPERQASELASEQSSQTNGFAFSDISISSQITFVHNNFATGKYYLVEAMTGGLALFDFDLDRLVDVYFCNGKPIGQLGQQHKETPVFFRNIGETKFADITLSSSAAAKYYCLGVTVGDYDNDGFPDLYLSNFGPNQLLHNNGDGTFSDRTTECQVANGDRFGAGVSFADFNNDGTLDLFVGNYVKLASSDLTMSAARTKYPGPLDFPTETCTLFLNDGAGGWVDATSTSKIGDVSSTAMGVICGDFDEDGDTDIYVANDEMPNSLFINAGDATFTESAYSFGVAVDSAGRVNGSMGIDAADVDNDGKADILVTSFERELVTLYQMTNYGAFKDASQSSHIGDGTAPHVTWGCCLVDFDNDGDKDAYVGSGHFDENSNYCRVRDLVFKNLYKESGKLVFREISNQTLGVDQIAQCSRGTAVADLDNDGDQDLVTMNVNAPCTVLKNDLGASAERNWLKIKLVGTTDNRDAVGAKVFVTTNNCTIADEVRNGRGYQSYWGGWLHFGLGTETQVAIKVLWPNGTSTQVPNVLVNSGITLVQHSL